MDDDFGMFGAGFGGAPAVVKAMCGMLIFHGFILDVLIIGIIPMLSADKATLFRTKLFPWCLGGYGGWGPNSPGDNEPNYSPAHRRFIAENQGYAVLRGAAGLFTLYSGMYAGPVLVMAVASHLIEAMTIAWEIFSYNAPKDAVPPMTLMGLFSLWVTLTCHFNRDDLDDMYIIIEDKLMMTMYALCGLTWICWLIGIVGLCRQGKVTAG